MKKILTTGALLSIITPVAMTVSCGSKDTHGVQKSVQFIKLHQDDMLKRHSITSYNEKDADHFSVMPSSNSQYSVMKDGQSVAERIDESLTSGEVYGSLRYGHMYTDLALSLKEGFNSFSFSNEINKFHLNDVPSKDNEINVDDIEGITVTNTKKTVEVFWEGNTSIKQAHAIKRTLGATEPLTTYSITLQHDLLKSVDFWIKHYEIHRKSRSNPIIAYRKSSFVKLFNKVYSVIGQAPSSWAVEIDDAIYLEDSNYKSTPVKKTDSNKWLIYGDSSWMPNINTYNYIIEDSVLDRLVS